MPNYKKSCACSTKLIAEFNDALSSVDFLVGPVAPTTAFAIGENNEDPLQMYLVDIMTVAANLVGVPSISIPVDPSKESNMPIGLQIMASSKAMIRNYYRLLLHWRPLMITILITVILAIIVLFALFGLVTKNPEIDKTPFRTSWKKIIEKSETKMVTKSQLFMPTSCWTPL